MPKVLALYKPNFRLAGVVGVLVLAVVAGYIVRSSHAAAISIWPDTATPAVAAENDSASVEVGVKFNSDVSGKVTAIRFYKGSGNGGTHTGSLWSSTGTKLGSVTFSGETATGWQTASLSTPITITAGTTYIASYFAPQGHYASTSNGLDNSVDNPPLHALSGTSSGGNGVYAYSSASAFPTQSFNNANYWVDVTFQADQAGGNVIGDLNNDNTVNIFDLSILLSKWGTSDATADLNHDNTVNIFDLSTLLSHWGQTATPTPTPTRTPAPSPTPTATPGPTPAISDGRDVATFSGTGINIGITPKIGPAATGYPTYTRDSNGLATCASGLTVYTSPTTLAAGTYDKRCFRGGGFSIPDGVTITNSVFLVNCGDTPNAGLQMRGTGSGSPASITNAEITSLTLPPGDTTDPSCDRGIGVLGDGGWTLDHVWVHGTSRGMYFASHGVDPSTWSSSTTYAQNSLVMYNDGSALSTTNENVLAYISLTNNNTGNTPTKSGTNWRVAKADDFIANQPNRMRVLKDSMIGNTQAYSGTGNHTSTIGHGVGAHAYYVAIQRTAFVNMSRGASSGMIQIYPELGGGPDGSAGFWLMEKNYFTGTNGLVCTQFGGSGNEIDHHDMTIRNNLYGILWDGTSCTSGTVNADSDGTMGSRANTLRNTWTNNVWYAPGLSKDGTAIGG